MELLLEYNFHLNGHTLRFHPQTQNQNRFVQHNTVSQEGTAQLKFHLNAHTLGFHAQPKKLEPLCTA